MPYKKNADLPEPVRHVLPAAAQTIFREAFNAAHEEYKDPSKRRDPKDTTDAVAARVAWAAVKKEFHKDKKTGKWVEN